MRRSLTTMLVAATLMTYGCGKGSYKSPAPVLPASTRGHVQRPASAPKAEEDSFISPSSQRYVPAQITDITYQTRSTAEASVSERFEKINETPYVVYTNEFRQPNELELMLTDPDSRASVYSVTNQGTKMRKVPTNFLVPARLEGENNVGKIVPAEYVEIKVGSKPLILPTLTHGEKTFYVIPRSEKVQSDDSPFYLVPMLPGEENIVIQDGTARVYGFDSDGVTEEGEGVFRLTKHPLAQYGTRKTAHEAKILEERKKEAAKKEAEESRIKAEDKERRSGSPVFN